MNLLKQLISFACVPIAAVSIYFMIEAPQIPPWQIISYTFVLTVPCTLILLWKPFDRFFGFAPPRATNDDHWSSITPWIGWMILAAMILLNHFARPPA